MFFYIEQCRTHCFAYFRIGESLFSISFKKPEQAEKLTSHKHIKMREISLCTGKNIFGNHSYFRIIAMFRINMNFQVHTSVNQRKYAFFNTSVCFGFAEDRSIKYKRIIYLTEIIIRVNSPPPTLVAFAKRWELRKKIGI